MKTKSGKPSKVIRIAESCFRKFEADNETRWYLMDLLRACEDEDSVNIRPVSECPDGSFQDLCDAFHISHKRKQFWRENEVSEMIGIITQECHIAAFGESSSSSEESSSDSE